MAEDGSGDEREKSDLRRFPIDLSSTDFEHYVPKWALNPKNARRYLIQVAEQYESLSELAARAGGLEKVEDESVSATGSYAGSIWLDALLPFEEAEDVHANLREAYPIYVARHGERRACWVVNAQIGIVILRRWGKPLLNALDKVRGIFGGPAT